MKYFKYIIEIAIPAIAAYLASNDNIIVYLISRNVLSSHINIESIQTICLLINFVFTTFYIYVKIIRYEFQIKANNKRIAGLYAMIKQFAQSNFEKITKNSEFDFEMRIFVREKNRLDVFKVNKEEFFSIRNIHPFAKEDMTEKLRFRVYPEPQGLVGQCFNRKGIIYEENLKDNNGTYGLDEVQLMKTSELKWSICVPVLDDKNNVVAIVAYDSQVSRLNIEKNKEDILKLVNPFSQMLFNSAEDLFKPKVVIKW